MSAGEAVGDAVFDWCRAGTRRDLNEMFGQTEINYIVGNCAMNGSADVNVGWPARPGSMGRAYPGHRVALIERGRARMHGGRHGRRGDLHAATARHAGPDLLSRLLEQRGRNGSQIHDRRSGLRWCRTGDLASRDADGYLWYQGRADDVFKAAGYRIGPSEIENCLVKHPAVANAAVVPKPDRTAARWSRHTSCSLPDFVARNHDTTSAPNDFEQDLVAELQQHVKARLAPYEYPKEIEFIDAAADDHHRQGSAPRAAAAGGTTCAPARQTRPPWQAVTDPEGTPHADPCRSNSS